MATLQAMAAQAKSQLETSGKRLPVRSNLILIHGISGNSSWSVTVRVNAEAGMTKYSCEACPKLFLILVLAVLQL